MSLDIQAIVEHLRAPPFNRSEGLVDFSKKSPLELLQVVSDVFALIDDNHRKDVREEAAKGKEELTTRMMQFITVLGYKTAIEDPNFGVQFMNGNPDAVYPFLLWLLENFPTLRTRGFLARYLVPLSIPEEHFADAAVVSMYQQYTMRQAEFKEIHRQLEEVRRGAADPAHLQQEVSQLEHEKEQLHSKLESLRNKIAKNAEYASVDFDEMLAATNLLRQEQEQEAKLHQDAQEQRHRLAHAEQVRAQTARRFQEMNQSDMATMEPNRLLQRLRDEVAERRAHLEERVEGDIADSEKTLKQLIKLANNTADFTPDDVHELQRENHELHAEIEELQKRREQQSAAAPDSKVAFIRARLTGVEKQREKLAAEVASLQEEQREAEQELRSVTAEFKQLTGATAAASVGPDGRPRPQTDAQMKEYMNELARKTQRYKTLKAELEHERSEIAILVRTEEILRSRAANLSEFNAAQERKLGVVGYGQTQEQLEAIAAQTNAVNEGKGATLEELSEIIERIKASMLRKKDKLTPQITELRGVRAEFEAIEQVYRKKKAQYDNVSLGFESERLKLEQDVQSNAQAVADDQSHFHFLNAFAQVTTARQIQVAKEFQFKDLYEKAIAAQEAGTKQLRQEKKTVSEKHDEHVKQRALFGALKTILQKKLDITRNPNAGSATSTSSAAQKQQGYQAPQRGSGSASYLDELAEETNRLVLEQ